MEQSEQDLLLKSYSAQCLDHPLFQCIFLHLKKNAKRSKICYRCKTKNKISDEEVYCIAELLTFPENEITIDYPFSKDLELIEFFSKLKKTPDTMAEKIETFFDEMQVTINNKINEAKKSALMKAAKISQQTPILEKSYEGIASIFAELKEALLKFTEEELNNFITEKFESQEIKINQLKADIDQYQRSMRTFYLETQMEKVENLSKIISDIDCYSASPEPPCSLLKQVKFEQIQKLKDDYLRYRLSISLEYSQLYIIRISITKPNMPNLKGYDLKIFLYYEGYDRENLIFQSDKLADNQVIVKGDLIQAINQLNSSILEVRIDFRSGYTGISDYPLFQNIIELKTSFYQDSYNLRFVGKQQQQVQISEIMKVPEFDLKMKKKFQR